MRLRARDSYSLRGIDSGAGRAFDAASATGLAFLTGQLEQIDPDPVLPLEAVTHMRDLDIDYGGGFPEFVSAYAVDYRTVGTGSFGLQRNDNTDMARVQANVTKGLYETFIAAYNMEISFIDLEKLEFAKRTGQPIPMSLQQMYEECAGITFNKALDLVTYLGFNGFAGLINNAAVAETVVLTGASGHTDWARKTPQEILNDVIYLLNAIASNAAYDSVNGLPNRLLVPWAQYGLLVNPFTLDGIGTFASIIEYIEKQVGKQYSIDFKIEKLPAPWIAGQGAGATDRAVMYRKDKKAVYLKVPQPLKKMGTFPQPIGAGAYVTTFAGCVAQVIWKRTQTAIYGDGI
jgi:hypothetical protein